MPCSFSTRLAAVALLASAGTLAARAETASQTPAAGGGDTPPPPAATDYAIKDHWLCWPGRGDDACNADLTTTVVAADGGTRIEKYTPDPKPAIDCFYVYPTVSQQRSFIATLDIEEDERRVVVQQFARFGARCRLFAPMYRQITLVGLRAFLVGVPMQGSDDPAYRDAPYRDVKAAWDYYLAHENHGRGVVLIGHSQGSKILSALLANEIDGKPAQKLLVSAILLGENVAVPPDADVGGTFKSIPVCRRAAQTGCTIAYVSFRAGAPPPADSLFGRPWPRMPGMVDVCANPAALAGGTGALKAYFAAGTHLIADNSSEPVPWAKGVAITTPFVSVPGLVSGACESTDGANYLAITVHGDPADPRTDEIPGDIVRNGVVHKEWGLHLIDANLAMGNLLDDVGAQAAAWGAVKH